MMPPEAGVTGNCAAVAAGPPAVSVYVPPPASAPEGPPQPGDPRPPVIEVLKKRADFLRAASARRQGTPGFLLQARPRDETELIRVGFTCSKKIGNAVARNRAKRRLREVARALLATQGRPGWDYVLVGRPGATIDRPFAALLADMAQALRQVHAEKARKP